MENFKLIEHHASTATVEPEMTQVTQVKKTAAKAKAPKKSVRKSATITPLNTGLSHEVELITPDVAEDYLSRNIKNRKISDRHVSSLAREITQGNWRLTNSGIAFNHQNVLIDGQHRLRAIIKAGMPVMMLVVRGLDDNAQMAIDTGRKRTAADVLHMQGEKYSTNTAATVRWLHTLSTGFQEYSISTNEIMQFLEKYPDVRNSVSAHLAGKLIKGMPHPLLAAIHYIAKHCLNDAETAEMWVHVWRTGVPNYEGDPVQYFREKLIHANLSGNKMLTSHMTLMIIHVFNLLRKRVPVTMVKQPKSVVIETYDPRSLGYDNDAPVFENIHQKMRKAAGVTKNGSYLKVAQKETFWKPEGGWPKGVK